MYQICWGEGTKAPMINLPVTDIKTICYILWIMFIFDYDLGWSSNFLLTHWGQMKMAASLQATFSNVLFWMKMLELLIKLIWNIFQEVLLTLSKHWFRIWLGVIRWQAITWINDDPGGGGGGGGGGGVKISRGARLEVQNGTQQDLNEIIDLV